MFFQTCMAFFLLWNTEEYIFEELFLQKKKICIVPNNIEPCWISLFVMILKNSTKYNFVLHRSHKGLE